MTLRKKAIIVGATGLIGEELLNMLLIDNDYDEVIAVTRKQLDAHQKLKNIVIDFEQLDTIAHQLIADDVFCCLGTTMKKAGSKKKFKKVDYNFPLQIAKITKEHGAKQFLLVSSLGANNDSSAYYNKVKGQIEEAIESVNFNSYHIFRPSLLMGDRDESRFGESAAQLFFKALGFAFVGPLEQYKGIEYDKVARAMIDIAKENQTGKHIHESISLQKY